MSAFSLNEKLKHPLGAFFDDFEKNLEILKKPFIFINVYVIMCALILFYKTTKLERQKDD